LQNYFKYQLQIENFYQRLIIYRSYQSIPPLIKEGWLQSLCSYNRIGTKGTTNIQYKVVTLQAFKGASQALFYTKIKLKL